jgi:hypothetical protein
MVMTSKIEEKVISRLTSSCKAEKNIDKELLIIVGLNTF